MRSYVHPPADLKFPQVPREFCFNAAAPSNSKCITGAAYDVDHRRIELQRCRELGRRSCEGYSYAPGIWPSGSERLIHILASRSMSARCSGSSMLSARDKQSNALARYSLLPQRIVTLPRPSVPPVNSTGLSGHGVPDSQRKYGNPAMLV